MAARYSTVILLDRTTWQLARSTANGIETTPPSQLDWTRAEDVAIQIKSALDAWKIGRRSVVVGLSSSFCVSALLRLPTPRHARQRQAMAYLLEPFLPWPAEEIVADFECSKVDAFAVATSLEPLSELISRFEELGIRIESIAPIARLALHGELKQHSNRASRFVLVWADDQAAELWLVDRKRPILWRHLDLDAELLVQELKQLALDESIPLSLAARGLPRELTDEIATAAGFIYQESSTAASETMLESAVRVAGEILKGTETSPIEFRRDGLSHRDRHRSIQSSLRAVQLSFLCLFAAIGFALFQLGDQLDQRRRQTGDQQADLFRKLFPGTPVPVGVQARLESEHAKLMGMRGNAVELPGGPSAVNLIERLLFSLPADMRYRILEVRVEQGRMYMVGQAREHADADRIAEELRKANLVVESPSTHRLPQKGVEFRISAHLPAITMSTKEARR